MSLTFEELQRRIDDPSLDIEGNDYRKKVYEYACTINRSGRPWSDNDVIYCGENYMVKKETIEKIFRSVYETNKEEHGFDEMPMLKKTESFLSSNYVFRHNIITDEWQHWPKNNPQKKAPINSNTFWRELQHVGIKQKISDVRALMKSSFVPDYDPFEDYFSNIPKWDGKIDWIDMLASYVKTEDDGFFKTMFKKALVRSIPCSLGKHDNRMVIVLVNEEQDQGKSFFIRWLNPFGKDYYCDEPFMYGKDSAIALCENFIYNLEELEELSGRELVRMKAAISKTYTRLRRPYSETQVSLVRRATFWGSTNKPQFLTDDKNTRWLCFRVHKIDWEYNKCINVQDVWSQAYSLYKDGFNYFLTPEERQSRDTRNKRFEYGSVEKDLISTSFRHNKNATEFITIAGIVQYLSEKTNKAINMSPTRVEQAMKQLGFQKIDKELNGHMTKGYMLDKHTLSELEMNHERSDSTPDEFDNLPF